ncbi:MAG: ribonuclease III [Chitinispirillaceae bacterium]|jgi:ribonuclease-3
MSLLKPLAQFFRSLVHLGYPGNSEQSLKKVQKIIGYRFRSQTLLRQSLTHKSSVSPENGEELLSNERLEFLGDAVLNCLVTEHLYHTYPDRHEGQLSKIKSLIVSRKILGEIARSFDIGPYIIFGASEEKTGGKDRMSILSNTFEAILGAVFLDGGFTPAGKFLKKLLFDRIDEILEDERHVNYKSLILELAQRDGFGMPRYETIGISGPDHAKEFTVRIEIGGVVLGEGSGSNKKIAQQVAAQNALALYDKEMIIFHSKGVVKDELVSHR